jgi:Domain of unknown function (DUF4468) with TBP-like fold
MKTVIFVALSCLLFVSCETTKKIEPKKYPSPFQYQITDTLDGSKNELYVRAYEWMAKTFNSSKEVIQMQDKEAGKIIGKGILTTPTGKDGLGMSVGNEPVHFTISIDVRDGKYRCILSDFSHDGIPFGTKGSTTWAFGNLDNPNENGFYGRKLESVYFNCEYKAKLLLQSLKEAMRKKTDNF